MESTKRFILRKLSATFVATTIFAFLFGIVDGFEFEMKYNQGNQFIQRFYFYAIYIGAIILFYGNIVSIVVEKIQMKWFPQYNWLYVFILGVFGLANGLLFQVATFGGGFALLGMLAAILYGIIDKWLFMRMTKNKSIKMFLILPIISLLLCCVTVKLN